MDRSDRAGLPESEILRQDHDLVACVDQCLYAIMEKVNLVNLDQIR